MSWRQTRRDLHRLDLTVYTAVATSPTPSLDSGIRKLSDAANYSRLSFGIAAGLAAFGGCRGRRAAVHGVASIAVTSGVLNAFVKPLARRHRPDRLAAEVPEARHVRMPESHSFPSGHSAAAFAFAAGAGHVMHWTVPPLALLASSVAYSRVHTGVHYPGDVLIGSICGVLIATATNSVIDRLEGRR